MCECAELSLYEVIYLIEDGYAYMGVDRAMVDHIFMDAGMAHIDDQGRREYSYACEKKVYTMLYRTAAVARDLLAQLSEVAKTAQQCRRVRGDGPLTDQLASIIRVSRDLEHMDAVCTDLMATVCDVTRKRSHQLIGTGCEVHGSFES